MHFGSEGEHPVLDSDIDVLVGVDVRRLLHLGEDLGLLCGELLFGEDALLLEGAQFGQLLHGVGCWFYRGCSGGGLGRCGGAFLAA